MGARHCRHQPPASMLRAVAVMGGKPGDVYRHPDGSPILRPKSEWWMHGTCEYGNCMEMRCPVCGCHSGAGWGPVGCPCEDWVGFHDMRHQVAHAAVKPSLRRRGWRKR